MSELLCPWCGGELPGEPGQFVKCRHCASDFYWGDNKPWRTKMQAANASQAHPAGLSPAVEDVAPTPSESDFAPAESLPPPVPLWVNGGLQNLLPSWIEKRRLKSIARKREEAAARRRLDCDDDIDMGDWWLVYRSPVKACYFTLVASMILMGVTLNSMPGGDNTFLTGVVIALVTTLACGLVGSVAIPTAPKSVQIIGGLLLRFLRFLFVVHLILFFVGLPIFFVGLLIYELWRIFST